jgi:peptidoglycan/xylan/chitin deacetylase (PgdA/CDA1 family)
LPLLKKYSHTATFYIWVTAVGRKHYMSWDQIKELSPNGMQLGCHNFTHPYLTRIKKDEDLQRELSSRPIRGCPSLLLHARSASMTPG